MALSDEQRELICKKYAGGGVSQTTLGEEFSVSRTTIKKLLNRKNVTRPDNVPTPAKSVSDFLSRCHSVLWPRDGAKRTQYNRFDERIKELEEEAGYTKYQAIVRAAKEFDCLKPLFREYDLREFDPNPESHNDIQMYGGPLPNQTIPCEGIEQSYRDSLRWAMDAAGKTGRTGKSPVSCPCDQAYYLYRMAIEEPKDFMGKVGQIESKGDQESADKRATRKAGQKAIAEIDGYLAELEAEQEGERA